jgi:hypothetical protein
MYEDYKVIPDTGESGQKYIFARFASKLLPWSIIGVASVGMIASFISRWGVVAPAGFFVLLAFAAWKLSRIRDPDPPPCPKCGIGSFLIRKKKSIAGERSLLFGCHKCRVAVDSGIVEDGVLDG